MDKFIEVQRGPGQSPSIVIIGAGHFGQRAVDLLCGQRPQQMWVVDREQEALAQIQNPDVVLVQEDGAQFLVDRAEDLAGGTRIIPAVPFHLASEFARLRLTRRGYDVATLRVPVELKALLPHVWDGPGGSLLASYADFKCPDNCPEPEYCTITGEKRDIPMYELLQAIKASGYQTYGIRSHQMVPGLGGYDVIELLRLCATLEDRPGKWLIGTACSCHGVLSALKIRPRP